MGYKYNEQDMLDAAVDVVLEEGLLALTYGSLAKRMGVADRSIVYYFHTKEDLVTKTVLAIGAMMQTILADAFGDAPRPKSELMRLSWPALTTPAADRVFAVFFEMVGLAAAGKSPFDVLAPAAMELWVDWLIPRIDTSGDDTGNDTGNDKRPLAYAIVATLDGLLLLRHTCGAEAAEQAATQLWSQQPGS